MPTEYRGGARKNYSRQYNCTRDITDFPQRQKMRRVCRSTRFGRRAARSRPRAALPRGAADLVAAAPCDRNPGPSARLESDLPALPETAGERVRAPASDGQGCTGRQRRRTGDRVADDPQQQGNRSGYRATCGNALSGRLGHRAISRSVWWSGDGHGVVSASMGRLRRWGAYPVRFRTLSSGRGFFLPVIVVETT